MKIGLFTDTYYPRLNGVANSVYMLKLNLEAMGHQVYVFTTTDPDAPEKEKNVIRIPSVPFKTQRLGTFVSPLLYWEIRDLSLDLIHTHTEYTLGIFGRLMARWLSVPFVHTMHTVYEYYTDYIIKSSGLAEDAAKAAARKYTAAFCNSADRVIAPTGKINDLLLSYGVKRPIWVIPSGIPLEKFDNAHCDRARILEIRGRLGIAPGDKVIVNIGRVAKEKNIDEILLALRDYLPAHRDTKLLIVGDGPARGELEAMAARLGISGQVIFAGARPWDEIALYYRQGDVFVAASQSETQGLTYVEAMASGLPVIAREDPCLDGVLIDGQNGFSFKTTDGLASALERLMEDDFMKARFSEKALEISQKLSAQTYAHRAATLYAEMITNRWYYKGKSAS